MVIALNKKEMAKVGHRQVLTSTQSNEQVHFFIEKTVIPNAGAFAAEGAIGNVFY